MKIVKSFTGKKQFFDYYSSLERDIKRGDFYYAFAFQNEYQSKEAQSFLKSFHAKLAKKKIDDRAIFNTTNRVTANATYRSNKNLKIQFKNFKLPVGLVITKDRILQLGWKPSPFIIEIKNNTLLRYYTEFFLESWNTNNAVELTREILERFNIRYRGDALRKINNLLDYPTTIRVTESIEKIESTWRYHHRGHEKDFGQKVKGETIKLWSVPKTTAELLEYFVVATESKNILEIGTSAGYSTLYLAMGAAYTGGRVTTIEKLEPKIRFAKKNIKNSGLRNIHLLKGNAFDILGNGKLKNIDLVFLDADKENYGKYFKLCMPILKKGGFIIADNVYDYGHLMKDYLDKVLGTKLPNSQSDKRVRSYTLPMDNGVIFTRKIKG